MKVLLTGATGFIGRHLAQRLLDAEHQVIGCARNPRRARARFPRLHWIGADFTRDLSAGDWLGRLAGVDSVINAVGILRERGRQTFEAIHYRAPAALFDACAEIGIGRVVQISALGADGQATSRYHSSKKAADDHLAATVLSWVVVQPSLVYGEDSPSSRLFRLHASLPLIPLVGDGTQYVQPIHVEDLCALIGALLQPDAPRKCVVPAVGPRPVSMREYLGTLRIGLNKTRPRFLPVPLPMVQTVAWLGDRMGASSISVETLGMLLRGNVANVSMTEQLLGHAPRPITQFLSRATEP